MGPNLAKHINNHAEILRKINSNLRNIEQRLAFLEVKMDQHLRHTKDGNNSRNVIMILVAAKVFFEGFQSIDLNTIGHLVKMFGG